MNLNQKEIQHALDHYCTQRKIEPNAWKTSGEWLNQNENLNENQNEIRLITSPCTNRLKGMNYKQENTEPTIASDFSENIYNFEDRLVRYAGEVKLWYRRISKDEVNKYYGHQLLRASGSAGLNFGEAQGTVTTKDFIFKMTLVLKELRECKVNLRILNYGEENSQITELLQEAKELMAISAKMILNAQKKLGEQ